MNVIDMILKLFLISNHMIPKPFLPNRNRGFNIMNILEANRKSAFD